MDYADEYSRLVDAGFKPGRHGFLVKLIRKILWPVVRPFNLFIYHELLELKKKQQGFENQSLAYFGDLLNQTQATRSLHDHLSNEMPKFIQPLIDIRAELAELSEQSRGEIISLRNRYAQLEAMNAHQAAAENEVFDLHKRQIAAMTEKIDAIAPVKQDDGRLGDLQSELVSLVNRNSRIEKELERLSGQNAAFAERLRVSDERLTQAHREEEISLQKNSLIEKELEKLNDQNAAFAERLRASDERLAHVHLEEEISQLRSQQQQLEAQFTSRNNADFEGLQSRVLELSDRLVEFEAGMRDIDWKVGDFGGRVDSSIAAFQEEVGGLSTKLETVRTARTASADATSVLSTRMDGIEGGLGQLQALLQDISSIESRLDSEITAVGSRADAAVNAVWAKAQDLINQPQLILCNADDGVAVMQSGDLISQHVRATGKWDHHIVDLMSDVAATRGGTAVDVGGHFGVITMAMARRFAHVHAFEPNDFSFKLLSANMALNGLTNVDLHNTPLYSKEAALSLAKQELQEMPLACDEDGAFNPLKASNIASYSFSEDGTNNYLHQALTLDSFGLTDVTFIKVDTQGADGEVLMGAVDTIKRCSPVVVFEWEDHLAENFTVSLDQLRDTFRTLGYSLNILKRHNEKQADYVAYPVAVAQPKRRSQ